MKNLTSSEIVSLLTQAAQAVAPLTLGEYSVRLQVGENLFAEIYGNTQLPGDVSTRVYSINEDAQELTHNFDINLSTGLDWMK